MPLQHLNIHVFGVVQGVSFRAYTQDKAESLGITGFVCNEPDDSVYIEAEGTEDDLAQFLRWCHQGPPLAQVEQVEVTEWTVRNFHDFRITWGQQA